MSRVTKRKVNNTTKDKDKAGDKAKASQKSKPNSGSKGNKKASQKTKSKASPSAAKTSAGNYARVYHCLLPGGKEVVYEMSYREAMEKDISAYPVFAWVEDGKIHHIATPEEKTEHSLLDNVLIP